MAKITLNNKENAKDIICFNTTPHIIEVENTSIGGTKAHIQLKCTALRVSQGKVGEININGYVITSTSKIENVKGRKFYDNSGSNAKFCALSIANALKSIPQLALNYDIKYDGEHLVSLTAKNEGAQYNITVTTNNVLNLSILSETSGKTLDSLVGEYTSKIYVDLYTNNSVNQRLINSVDGETSYDHLITLQKEYIKDKVSFNVSPALASISDYGKTTIWKAKIYAMVDGEVTDLGEISDNYIINGYLVNQGGTSINNYFEQNVSVNVPALNVQRGKERDLYNNSILYIYEPSFTISLYNNGGIEPNKETAYISYLESDEEVIYETSQALGELPHQNLVTYNIELDEEYLREAYYVDIRFKFGTLRLNVINPPYSQIENHRIFWFNSYGGVSFFDFVGDKKEERSTELQTYKKSLLDFYTNNDQEQEVVYFRENNITVSLTTHLIEKDGLYQLYDLQNSYKAWTVINGVKYYIIVEDLSIEEPADNVYTVTIKYKYSLLDSFA